MTFKGVEQMLGTMYYFYTIKIVTCTRLCTSLDVRCSVSMPFDWGKFFSFHNVSSFNNLIL